MGIVEDQQAICDGLNEKEAPVGRTALELHQEVYRDRRLPLHLRLRAARDALPYETPKLAVSTNIQVDGEFAALLDRAILRSRLGPPRLIEGRMVQRAEDEE